MILYGDYHTHTIFSHGSGTVLDNAIVAARKGLKEIAITDHGFRHKTFGMSLTDMDKLKNDCLEATKQTGVKVLLGVESNFISLDGTIDLTSEQVEMFDIVLCGYHNFVWAKTPSDSYNLFFKNIISPIIGTSKKQIEKNTNCILRAMDKNPCIKVLTHVGYGMKVDALTVAREARDRGVLIELNGKRIHFTDEEILIMTQEKVNFIIDSDAHRPERVGECNRGTNLALRLQIPYERIANVNHSIFKENI
ncbi:MAG: PHP domain-containing protein [Clostridia bacterium]